MADKPIRLKSREYKVMLDHLRFSNITEAVSSFWSEVKHTADTIQVEVKAGELELEDRRMVSFFDTPDHSFRRNDFVLRKRQEMNNDLQYAGNLHYTLKCRSPDRYIAAGADIKASQDVLALDGVDKQKKLEEDIASPFISRFSRSNKLTFKQNARPAFGNVPKTVADCGSIFPVLNTLTVDGRPFPDPDHTPVEPVNGLEAYERVFKKEEALHFHAKDDEEESVKADVAVILWSLGVEGRPLVAEFSFKYKDEDKDRHFNHNMAREAKRFFECIQQMDWVLRGGRTKTGYVYGQ